MEYTFLFPMVKIMKIDPKIARVKNKSALFPDTVYITLFKICNADVSFNVIWINVVIISYNMVNR